MVYYEQTGKMHPMIADGPKLPLGCEMLWKDFLELHGCRASNGFAPSRITFTDIDAWQRIRGVKLPRWQIDAIRAADNEFLASLPKSKVTQ